MMKKKFLAFFIALVLCLSVGAWLFGCASAKLESISIKTKPTKTAYTVGEEFDPTGMVVIANYDNDEEKELAIADYTYSPAEALTASDKKITITYTENGVTKEITQAITVSNPVTAVTIKTAPTKTEYYIGEKFDPTGMVLTVTYTDETVKDVTVSEDSSVTYKTEKLTDTDTSIVLTVGDKTVSQPITLLKGIYIEAEEAIINSEDVAINTDSAEASGGVYVGNMFAGDSIGFKFVADAAGKADIAFRLASLYLKEDSNWTPILMGDCQFNEIVKFSINGAPYTISDDVILPGGGESGGEPDSNLWFNWKEVVFENVDLIEGTNVVLLEFIPHDYTDTSQASFSGSFTANVDSLKVTTSDITITEQPYTYEVTSAKIVKVAADPEDAESVDSVVCEVKGSVLGYEENSFVLTFTDAEGNATTPEFDIVIDDGTFTATVDMSKVVTNKTYTVSFAAKDDEAEDVENLTFDTTNAIVLGLRTYNVVSPEDMPEGTTAIKIESDETYSVTSVGLETVSGKPCYVLEGAISGYTADSFVADFQQNNAWSYASNIVVNMTITGETYKATIDMTTLESVGNTWIPHFKVNGDSATGDIKKDAVTYTEDQSIEVDGYTYALATDAFDCVGVRKSIAAAQQAIIDATTFTATDVKLEATADKVYYVVSGTYTGSTKAQLETLRAQMIYFNLQDNPNAGGTGNWTTYSSFDGIIEATDTDFAIKYDITALAASMYTSHFLYKAGTTDAADLKFTTAFDGTAEGKSLDFGGKNYELVSIIDGDNSGSDFWGCVGLKITTIAAED